MIGKTVLDYEITEKLGEGGMATVYKGVHSLLGQEVAIKVMDPMLAKNAEMRERFIQEARIQAALRHPGIVQVLTASVKEECLCLIQEFVDGKSLESVLATRSRLSVEEVLKVFEQVLDAVGYAHSKGVIHRDLKPGNIVVCADGSTKVTDFGIAKIVGNANLTRTGVGMGTTAYMSPEQILGAKEVDHRADIYSLGATMFEALTGRPPFVIEGGRNTESDFLTMQAHVQSVPENPQDLVAAIPDKIANAILRALAKMASQRFSSCEEFLGAVNIGNSSCANGQKNNSRRPIEARPERSIARVDKEVRKKVSPDRLNELLEIEPARFGAFEASSHRPCDCPEQLSYHEAIAWASIHCLKLPTLSELEQMQQDSSFFEGSPKLNWFWCKSVQSDFRAYVWQYKAETQVIDRAIDDKERRYNVRCVQERI